ncbi:hypothetical protein [Paracoccus sp. (in: a-proteobacteria)]|uniref:hypothetical protein n=1 Tax=Paracoccus sp. TaxID=267 RepID=UPI00396C912C
MKIVRLTLEWVRMLDLSQNSRLHWRKKPRLVKNQKGMATAVAYHECLHRAKGLVPTTGDILVTLTCCPPSGTVYPDDDNFITAQKGALDAIAAVLGVDDTRD